MWRYITRKKQNAVVFMNPALPLIPWNPHVDNNMPNLDILMKGYLICDFSLSRTFDFFLNVIITWRTWCHPWYRELHNWFPCLGCKKEEEEKHEESFLASHLLVAVWHIFPRCLLKNNKLLSMFNITEKWDEHVENNAHYHRRTYNQCGAYKLIHFC